MNPQSFRNHSVIGKKSSGFTLVELLVAVTLGLLLTGAITAVFLASRQSFRTGEGIAQVQEEGRFASLLIAPVVRQAGYLPDPVISQTDPTTIFTAASSKLAIFGFDFAATMSNGYTTAGLPANAASLGDVLVVAFVGRNATAPVDTPLRTCLGDDVLATEMAVNIFFLTTTPGGAAQSLNCYTNIGPIAGALGTNRTRNEPLVVGVQGLAIRYGVDTDGDDQPNRYVDANAIAAADWVNVKSVQMTFTIDSADQVERSRANTAGDGVNNGRIRRTFNTTLQIRNRLKPA